MRHALPPLLFATFAAAAADASFAFRGVIAAHGSLPAALSAFAVATAVVACPLLVVALTVAFVHSRVSAVRGDATPTLPPFARTSNGASRAGAPADHRVLRALVVVAAVGFAATRCAIVGRALIAAMSPHLAATAIVVVTLGAAAVAWGLASALVKVGSPLLHALESRVPLLCAITTGLGARLVFALVIALLLDGLLPHEYVLPPAAAVAAWLVAMHAPVRAAWSRRSRVPRVRAFVVAVLVATIIAPHAMARLPGGARIGVSQRPPYGAMVLGVARRAIDRDHDGYSPILGGGDCDDSNRDVHPGAADVPGDGLDQDCSGADATPYTPPPAPRVTPPSSLAPRPNIVVVMVDALRPDHLGFAGYPRNTSPAIDRFRAGATWFRRAYSPAPNTRFALSSLFTGLPIERIPQRRGPGHDFTLEPSADTLAEKLDALGYDRAGFTISYVMQHMPGFGQGFRAWGTPWPTERGEDFYGKDAELTTDAAIEYVDKARGDASRPYFVFAHYQCTHDPYVRHAEHDFGPTEFDAYDSALAYCDDHIGRLLSALDTRDATRTVVVVMSDHGELLGEHGIDRHGSSLLEPAVRPLLLVRVPGCDVSTVDATVTLADLHPTLLSLASGAAPSASERAWSLGAFMFPDRPRELPERPAFLYVDDWRSGVHYEARGVRLGRFKLVRDLPTGAEAMFDLESDPGETRNLRRAMPAAYGELALLLQARAADGSPQ